MVASDSPLPITLTGEVARLVREVAECKGFIDAEELLTVALLYWCRTTVEYREKLRRERLAPSYVLSVGPQLHS